MNPKKDLNLTTFELHGIAFRMYQLVWSPTAMWIFYGYYCENKLA